MALASKETTLFSYKTRNPVFLMLILIPSNIRFPQHGSIPLVWPNGGLGCPLYTYPRPKLSAIKNSIMLLVEKLPYTTTREFGKACGKLISTKFVLVDIVQLKTRNL